ncbi:MAG: sigma-70 family RNA polymerase sigma factor [Bacteroidota bacterium]
MHDTYDKTTLAKEQKVVEASKKDPQAFGVLYDKYFKQVFRFIHGRVNDKDVTADLTSQVFLKALTNIHQFEYRGLPFAAWLFRIAVNEYTDYFRKAKKARFVVLEGTAINSLFTEMSFDESEVEMLKKKIPNVMSKLKPHELQVIELRFFESRSFKEIGYILDITENNAKVKTYRALDKLRKYFFKGKK